MASQENPDQSISAGKIALYTHGRRTGLTWELADEIALYDRQIRLWGVKAQEK